VVNTGDRTVIGRIAQLVMQTKHIETPLVKEINRLIKLISAMALAIGVVFLIVALAIGYPVLVAIVFVIGIVVANVPEGLLATVTVSLTLTAKRMAKKKVLIKSLSSVETLGSTSTICSDKTGTLTQNRMTVSHLYYNGSVHTNPGASGAYDANDATCTELLRIAAICNRATFADAEQVRGDRAPTKVSVQSWATIGDASESALLKLVHVVRSVDSWRDANPKLGEIPFNSTNKYQLSIHEPADGSGRLLLVIKGAPERIVARCATYLVKNGTEQKFGKRARADFDAAYVGLAKRGERVLGFAHLWLDAARYDRDFAFETDPPNFPVDGLCFVGLISLIDPPRDSVRAAQNECHQSFPFHSIPVFFSHSFFIPFHSGYQLSERVFFFAKTSRRSSCAGASERRDLPTTAAAIEKSRSTGASPAGTEKTSSATRRASSSLNGESLR
jgi:magnesium-transporting ATPase (P-type)